MFTHTPLYPEAELRGILLIKRFVSLRRAIGGSSTAKGIQEYLVLLSISETLRLRNASFLKFLISGATDIDKFLETKMNRPA